MKETDYIWLRKVDSGEGIDVRTLFVWNLISNNFVIHGYPIKTRIFERFYFGL